LKDDKKWTFIRSGGIVIDMYLIGNIFNQGLLIRTNGAGFLREAVQFKQMFCGKIALIVRQNPGSGQRIEKNSLFIHVYFV